MADFTVVKFYHYHVFLCSVSPEGLPHMFLKAKEIIQIFCQILIWVSSPSLLEVPLQVQPLVLLGQHTATFQVVVHCCGML